MQQTYTVELTDGRRILFSYRTAVAVFAPGRGYLKGPEAHCSVTTAKHANGFAGKTAPIVDAPTFADLIAPVSVHQ